MAKLVCLLIPFLAIFLATPAFAQACTTDAECEPRGPGFECNDSSQCEWMPPIGIPKPEFGIEETYRMYDVEASRNSGLTYNPSSQSGFYTHYVDNTAPGGCDNGSNGTEASPRCEIPTSLPEGSIVEVHGGPYSDQDGIAIDSSGTSTQPVFVRGIGRPAVLPGGTGGWQKTFSLRGSYAIVENFEFDGSRVRMTDPSYHHLAIRNSDVHSVDSTAVATNGQHLVIYNNEIHDTGNWQVYDQDYDYHGIKVNGQNVTIVDNSFYHLAGDGIQVSGGDGVVGEEDTIDVENVFVARNLGYENSQILFASKTARNVVFSQNTVFNNREDDVQHSAGGPFGYCLLSMFRANNIWFIFNTVYNCDTGILDSSNLGPTYAIGNLIHGTNSGIGQVEHAYQNTVFNSGRSFFNVGTEANNLVASPDDAGLDQLFEDLDGNNFRLQVGSPAIDTGSQPQSLDEVLDLYEATFRESIRLDLDRVARPQGTEWDLGAFEFQSSSCVDTDALLDFISQWAQGNITMPTLISRIAAWKAGTGC